ncbi:hypothetical protein CesoFtcFv8_010759 [Champsocephalus esox]|uniref:Uncharacterized protein n=1 Tax=Champsocephalus esox TaxID=159716 RepID=A0AAN8GWZ6_9TELE|nr:hypothetical protein CesoFtcFv8_010759 [Champsocephalus esox]
MQLWYWSRQRAVVLVQTESCGTGPDRELWYWSRQRAVVLVQTESCGTGPDRGPAVTRVNIPDWRGTETEQCRAASRQGAPASC